MKPFIVLIVLAALIGGGLYLVYQYGGFKQADPKQVAAEFRAAVKPEMTWEEVAAVREPKRRRKFDMELPKGRTPAARFDRQIIAKELDEENYPEGFLFEYHFSHSDSITVNFDEYGVMTGITELTTMKDLLHGKVFQ